MNQGVVRTSPVQQMVAAGGPNWYSRPPPHHPNFLAASQNNHFVHQLTPPLSASPPSWNDVSQEMPESWSQLLLGGMVSEEDKGSMGINHMEQVKKLETWELHNFLNHHSSDVKQENINSHNYGLLENNELSSNMLDFSHKFPAGKPDPSFHECNSMGIGGPATKKARIRPPSIQSTFKVRKEKLGDRITALHQLVSPFGKTDTASVLLEAMGYIRFLQSQVEALSLPYLGTGSTNTTHLHPVEREMNCLFPEEPGQLLNEECIKRKSLSQQKSDEEPKKDLRSRGLCLVPISCMLQVGNDNAADYWAPAFGSNF